MAYIQTVSLEAARGILRRVYDQALRRAGRIYQILRIQSLGPESLRASLSLYLSIMHGRSELSRAQREVLAVVVSRTNACHY